MRLVLIYDGPLKANGDAKHKHAIRRAIHPQLVKLWKIDPSLAALEDLNRIPLGKFNFLPLVAKYFRLVCRLEIIFLRPEAPGGLVGMGGDIDNRLKTLLDALSIPTPGQIEHIDPEPDEDPFCCLLEDDSQVASLDIKTERLLEPSPDNSRVRLLITAIAWPTEVTNLHLLAGSH